MSVGFNCSGDFAGLENGGFEYTDLIAHKCTHTLQVRLTEIMT